MGFLKKLTKLSLGLVQGRQGESDEIEIVNGVVVAKKPESQRETSEFKAPPKKNKTANVSSREGKQEKKYEDQKRKNGFRLNVNEKAFLSWLAAGARAERTKKEYIWDLRWWLRRAKRRGKTLEELTATDLEGAIKRLKPATAAKKLAALKAWARWRLREGNPALFMELEKVIKPKRARPLPRDLGPEKFEALKKQAKDLASAGDRRGLWIGLMVCGGLRISEIKTVEPYQHGVRVRGKGNKERYVPLPGWLLTALATIKKNPPGGWACGRTHIWTILVRDFGLRKPHSLRHTYASELVRRGYKIEEIQKLLGHENIQTTTIYARINVPDDVVKRLGM